MLALAIGQLGTHEEEIGSGPMVILALFHAVQEVGQGERQVFLLGTKDQSPKKSVGGFRLRIAGVAHPSPANQAVIRVGVACGERRHNSIPPVLHVSLRAGGQRDQSGRGFPPLAGIGLDGQLQRLETLELRRRSRLGGSGPQLLRHQRLGLVKSPEPALGLHELRIAVNPSQAGIEFGQSFPRPQGVWLAGS